MNTSKSQYSEYLDYIKQISDIAGFDTKLDKLRIPSTKRQCLVGIRNPVSSEKLLEIKERVFSLIAAEDVQNNFKARPAVERVRNCTQLDKDLIKRIIKQIVELLLKDEEYLAKENSEKWNKGKSIYIRDLPKYLESEDLNCLKQECGGLKTLMRNHRYIFDVQKDTVCLRAPLKRSSETLKYGDKPCWFLDNHPDGCLYSSENCAYKHV